MIYLINTCGNTIKLIKNYKNFVKIQNPRSFIFNDCLFTFAGHKIENQ